MFSSFTLDWAFEPWASGEGDDNDEKVTIQKKSSQGHLHQEVFVGYLASEMKQWNLVRRSFILRVIGTLQVFISCYEEWSCWSKFQASKKSSLDFCLKKRSAALTDTKLASKKRTFPPRFLSFLDLCLVFDYPDDPALVSLFFMANLQSVCIWNCVRCWVSAGIPSSLALVSFLSVKPLVVRCLGRSERDLDGF